MLMFFDRGAIAAVLPYVKAHWDLSGKQEGIIGSSFIITFSIGSAVFAYMANFVRVNLIMSFGLFVWTASAVLSGLWGTLSHGVDQQWGYYLLVISRALIGIGEASFVPLSVTLIDDLASKEYKTTYMSFFMVGVPFGVAMGYTISPLLVGLGSWTYCFYIEAIFGLFFGCLFLFVPLNSVKTNRAKKTDEVTDPANTSVEIEHKDNVASSDEISIVNISKLETHQDKHEHLSDDDDDGEDSQDALLEKKDDYQDDEIMINEPMDEEELSFTNEQRKQQAEKKKYQIFSFWSALKYLFCNPVYFFATLGSCGYSFCIGAIQFYAPSYVLHKMKQADSSITVNSDSANIATVGFSIAMLIASIIGTMSGGFIVDRFGGSNGMKGAARGLLFCTIFLILGFPWFYLEFHVASSFAQLVHSNAVL
ncbi:predicted protein [Naegleria gruberi]|uniref:Predicted protein n=1 Tax=Naegleria gruberi TaxID=5762 RepID=D2VE95_NAEGR|nr:uncharacterized protein NAEGRDRAFT_79629 [Naegleria gruberi]EFC44842.1 predicted protein [Naegleria gruberi]|eukprot:XP_002677586.1 predicted protein [Naegleria gruberi strain NEG-M]